MVGSGLSVFGSAVSCGVSNPRRSDALLPSPSPASFTAWFHNSHSRPHETATYFCTTGGVRTPLAHPNHEGPAGRPQTILPPFPLVAKRRPVEPKTLHILKSVSGLSRPPSRIVLFQLWPLHAPFWNLVGSATTPRFQVSPAVFPCLHFHTSRRIILSPRITALCCWCPERIGQGPGTTRLTKLVLPPANEGHFPFRALEVAAHHRLTCVLPEGSRVQVVGAGLYLETGLWRRQNLNRGAEGRAPGRQPTRHFDGFPGAACPPRSLHTVRPGLPEGPGVPGDWALRLHSTQTTWEAWKVNPESQARSRAETKTQGTVVHAAGSHGTQLPGRHAFSGRGARAPTSASPRPRGRARCQRHRVDVT